MTEIVIVTISLFNQTIAQLAFDSSVTEEQITQYAKEHIETMSNDIKEWVDQHPMLNIMAHLAGEPMTGVTEEGELEGGVHLPIEVKGVKVGLMNKGDLGTHIQMLKFDPRNN